jgi:multidrug efflux pump subunit AcrB
MMRSNLSEWALGNRSLIVFFMIIAVAAGTLAYFRLGRNEDPSFIIKTMVVQAAWPGASIEDTLNQITERLERKLQETPKLDFLRSSTRAGTTTIFVNLQGDTTAREVADIWYHVRKSIGDIRHTLPAGIVGPGFNDEFGDTFGIIYGFTADGFTHRELRTSSKTSARSSCTYKTSRRSTSWEPRTRGSSSSSPCRSSPAWASIDRR